MQTTPQAHSTADPALLVLLFIGAGIEALALALRPLLAHGLALLLTLAGWRPRAAAAAPVAPAAVVVTPPAEEKRPKPARAQAAEIKPARRRTTSRRPKVAVEVMA